MRLWGCRRAVFCGGVRTYLGSFIAACGNALVLRLGLAAYLQAHMVLAVLSVLLLLQLLWGPTGLFVGPVVESRLAYQQRRSRGCWSQQCWQVKGCISPALAAMCMHVGVQAEQLVAHTFCAAGTAGAHCEYGPIARVHAGVSVCGSVGELRAHFAPDWRRLSQCWAVWW